MAKTLTDVGLIDALASWKRQLKRNDSWNDLDYTAYDEILDRLGIPVCDDCGTAHDLTFDSCPYGEEIHGDTTKRWMCSNCRYQAAMDI